MKDKVFEIHLGGQYKTESNNHVHIYKKIIEKDPDITTFFDLEGNAYLIDGIVLGATLGEDIIELVDIPNIEHSGLQKETNSMGNFQIYLNNYDRSIEKMNYLKLILMRDFPSIEEDDIEIIIFGGERKKGIMGLRISICDTQIPYDYYRTNNFDYII